MRFLLLFILACLCACSNPPSSSQSTLRMAINEAPDSLDPRQARSLTGMTIAKMLYDGLTRIGPEGTPIPSVAEKIEISEDGCLYTFHLRKTFWSDQKAVVASDFADAWAAIRSGELGSVHTSLFSPISKITVIDPHTLQVELIRPTPYFLELTASSCYLPYRFEGVYNGPFSLEHFRCDDELLLQRNSTYWDVENVHLFKVLLAIVPNASTAVALFERGDLDWVGSPMGALPAQAVPHLRQTGSLCAWETAATLWLKLNTSHPPLHEPLFRRALALAIDRQALVTHVMPLGQRIATAIVPPLMGLQQGPLFADGDALKAQGVFEEALQKLHLTREELPPLILICSNEDSYLKLAQAIQQQWRQALGIEVRIEACEFKVRLERIQRGDYDIAGKIWFADYNDPTSFLDMYKTASDALNETGWESGVFASLLEQAAKETDLAKRGTLLSQAQELLISEMPVIPIYHHALNYLKTPDLQGVVLPPVSPADFKWATLAAAR
ncbi:MAG: peptide ABC transporter substrate-binding protein [Verrucomicrobia bacterium]|nr:peptide ABC transporter substrate-binding protein [Verrucomicrobiota bacterium]